MRNESPEGKSAKTIGWRIRKISTADFEIIGCKG